MGASVEVASHSGFQPILLKLKDGREVTVRAVCDDDKMAMREAFEHLSADSRYSRFMAPVRELSPAMLEMATHVPGRRDLALVAVTGKAPQEAIVGGARYMANPAGDDCEFAVTVTDEWNGVGLARQLMELLIEAARARGFHTMEGFILTSNSGMRGLARRLGFSDGPMPDDATVRLVRRQLNEPVSPA